VAVIGRQSPGPLMQAAVFQRHVEGLHSTGRLDCVGAAESATAAQTAREVAARAESVFGHIAAEDAAHWAAVIITADSRRCQRRAAAHARAASSARTSVVVRCGRAPARKGGRSKGRQVVGRRRQGHLGLVCCSAVIVGLLVRRESWRSGKDRRDCGTAVQCTFIKK
jgi:hypothetical protein